MQSNEIYQVLRQVGATASRLEKERILGSYMNQPEFVKVLQAAYDPYTTYGVTGPVVSALKTGKRRFNEGTWSLLLELSQRKLTGYAALASLDAELDALDLPDATLLSNILNRDLRAGFTAGTVNRVRPGTIPVFEVMLAHKYEEKRIKAWPVAVEPKKDGVRVIAIVSDDNATFYSRTGKEFTTFEHLKKPLIQMTSVAGLDHMVYDGEVVSGSFNKTVSEVRRKSEQATDAVFEVFDCFTLDEFQRDQIRGDYRARRALLCGIVFMGKSDSVKTLPQELAYSHDEIVAAYDRFRAEGFEGAIVKPLNGLYAKKRSHAWLKVKAEESEDLRVVGAFEGQGKYAGKLGGLIVERQHGDETVHVKVGGGFSDGQRATFWDAIQRETPIAAVRITGRLIEVEYHEVTPDGSLRHPRFVRFRDDKDRREVA